MSEYQSNGYYHNKQNCFNDIRVLQKAWGSLSFTKEQAVQGYKTLNIMWLECPKEVQYIVEATLNELERRCQFMGMADYKNYYSFGVPKINQRAGDE